MRKFAALVCALALMLTALPCMAETAVPDRVQTFFDSMNMAMGTDYPVSFAADPLAYVEDMPAGMASFTMSRLQYNSFYYSVVTPNTAVTVCCVDGEPAAYILDLNAVNFIGADDVTHTLLLTLPYAYFQAQPECSDSFGGYDLMTTKLLETAYADMSFGSDMLDYGDTLVSSHMFNLGSRTTLQLFPRSAYDGLTFEGEPLTPESNHDLSGTLALSMEYQLVTMNME